MNPRNRIVRLSAYALVLIILLSGVAFVRPIVREKTSAGTEIDFDHRPIGFRIVLPGSQWLVVFPSSSSNLEFSANSTKLLERKNTITTWMKEAGIPLPSLIELQDDEIVVVTF